MRFIWGTIQTILWVTALILTLVGVGILVIPGGNYLLEWGLTTPSRFQIDETRIQNVLALLAASGASLTAAILVALVAAVLSLSEPRRDRTPPEKR